jgi:hypothetical protein
MKLLGGIFIILLLSFVNKGYGSMGYLGSWPYNEVKVNNHPFNVPRQYPQPVRTAFFVQGMELPTLDDLKEIEVAESDLVQTVPQKQMPETPKTKGKSTALSTASSRAATLSTVSDDAMLDMDEIAGSTAGN